MMIKGITRDKHGFTDYSYVPLVWMAPQLAGFEEDKQAFKICRALSATVFSYSLLTDAKWGAVKVIPYKVHAALDLSLGIVALAAPALMETALKKSARQTLFLMGMTGIVIGFLSLLGARQSK